MTLFGDANIDLTPSIVADNMNDWAFSDLVGLDDTLSSPFDSPSPSPFDDAAPQPVVGGHYSFGEPGKHSLGKR